MILVMNNNNLELDRKTDVVGYKPRDSADIGADANEARASRGGSEETCISGGDAVDSDTVTGDDGGRRVSSTDSVMVLEKRPAESETHRVRKKSKKVRASELDSRGIGEIKAKDDKSEVGVNELVRRNSGSEDLEFNSAEEGGHEDSTPRAHFSGSREGEFHREEDKSDVDRCDPMPSISDDSEGSSRSNGAMAVVGQLKPLGYGFEIGDMVWGKVKSHPWWPGQIFSEAFATNSVRRTKREGHVLVAFFGDSSYGWFELAELVPFGPNFAEKSRQTNSRTFVKAVEEAVDEVSRRCGLGLACRCRNPYNFRPTDVKGYFAVDVGDYEPGIVYSAEQIKEARESFQPNKVLDFIKQLAVSPRNRGHVDIYFIKNKATALAYRKAAFEEFDETYAQAFGHQPVRPSRELKEDATKLVKVASRAPLSGPMVIAEALGKGKSSSKSSKIKDQSKKDRYLFKRRDEMNDSKTHGQPTFATHPVYLEGSSGGDYVMQKRNSTGSAKPQSSARREHTGTTLAASKLIDKPQKQVSDSAVVPSGGEDTGTESGGANVSSSNHDLVEKSSNQSQPAPVKIHGGEPVQSIDARAEGDDGGAKKPKVRKRPVGEPVQSIDARAEGNDGGPKKPKVRKRPVGETGAEKSAPLKKKKKREKELTGAISAQTSATMINVVSEKPIQVMSVPKEDSQVVDPQKEPNDSLLLDSTVSGQQESVMGHKKHELQELLWDLQALAVSHSFKAEDKNRGVVQQTFSRFRSLVYQKSESVLPKADDESNDPPHAIKSPALTGANKSITPSDDIKPPRPHIRFDDPSKSVKKRALSDRKEEEKAVKKKKFNDVKQLAADKRTTAEEKVGRMISSTKPELTKKSENAAKVANDPTMLVLKIPPGGNLPSSNELKARFARFGPLDHSGTRVFWKTSTCRVIYKHKIHAQAAYKFATGNNLFGNTNIICYLRDVEAAGPEPESGKIQKEDSPIRAPPARPAVTVAAQSVQQPGVQLKSCLKKPGGDDVAVVPGGNSSSGGGRGAPRVKFVLGGEPDNGNKVEQLMIGGNKNNLNNNNASFADSGSSSSSSSTVMNFNSKNFQNVVPPSSLPLFPQPNIQKIVPPPPLSSVPHPNTQFTSRPPPFVHNAQFNRPMNVPPQPPPIAQLRPQMPIPNLQYTEIAQTNEHNARNPNTSATAATSSCNVNDVEFTEKMMTLLTKCNEIVTAVKDMSGYMPYHPL